MSTYKFALNSGKKNFRLNTYTLIINYLRGFTFSSFASRLNANPGKYLSKQSVTQK